MKKILLLFFITLISLTVLVACSNDEGVTDTDKENDTEITPQPVITNEVDVIILCGQSNAEGHTYTNMLMKTNPELYAKYTSGVETKTKVSYVCNYNNYRQDTFESVRLGMGLDMYRFGPEVGMNEVFEKSNLNRSVYIIKYTAGGSNLYYQWRSPSSGNPGNLYNQMIPFIHQQMALLEEEGYIPYVKAICWMQGEADSCENIMTINYKEVLNNFINDLSNELSVYREDPSIGIKFIDAAISDSVLWVNYDSVNNSKRECAELDKENRYYLDTIKEGLNYENEPTTGVDLAHYDSLSMIKLGELFANAILSYGVLR